LPSLLKISPLTAVRRFIVEELDSQKSSSYVGPHILRTVVETMHAHKSVEHNAGQQLAPRMGLRLTNFSCCSDLFQSGSCAKRAV